MIQYCGYFLLSSFAIDEKDAMFKISKELFILSIILENRKMFFNSYIIIKANNIIIIAYMNLYYILFIFIHS